MCKWWTVEGLPGAGKAEFAEKFAEATGVKNFGTGHLLWELERLKVRLVNFFLLIFQMGSIDVICSGGITLQFRIYFVPQMFLVLKLRPEK